MDTMLGLVFVKEYFQRYPHYTFNYYQVNHRSVFDRVLQVSNTIYFIGILPSDTVLVDSLKLAKTVIIIDNKKEDALKLQAKVKGKQRKLRWILPETEEVMCVFQLCKEFFQRTVTLNVAFLASHIQDMELNRCSLPNSDVIASGLYAL